MRARIRKVSIFILMLSLESKHCEKLKKEIFELL